MSVTNPDILARLNRAREPRGKKEPKPIAKESAKTKTRKVGEKAVGMKPEPRQDPIKPRSKKRARQEGKYNRISKKLKQEHPECEAKLPGCQFNTMHIHHTAGRIGDKLLDVDDFLYVCDNCHRIIETKPEMAKELGLSKSRLAIKAKIDTMENTEQFESVDSILADAGTKSSKIIKLKAIGKTNKEIAELLETNQGHVWNVLNKKNKESNANQ